MSIACVCIVNQLRSSNPSFVTQKLRFPSKKCSSKRVIANNSFFNFQTRRLAFPRLQNRSIAYRAMSTQNSIERSPLHEVAKRAFLHALQSVAPEQLVRAAVKLDETKTKLQIASGIGNDSVEFDLHATPSILIMGAGKATQELVSGILRVLEECQVPNIKVNVQASYPTGQQPSAVFSHFSSLSWTSISLLEASHPISDERTVHATDEQVKQLYTCEPNTLVIVLMSGGGSALYETTTSFGGAPPSTITLQDLQKANKALIESGANITEINTIRKHFSQVKGGRTAQHAIQSGKVSALIGLYLSDVVGNDLSSVASGPTCPDASTFADCHTIIKKYNLREKLPTSIINIMDAAKEETPKPGDPIFKDKIFNFLIGSADTSAQAAADFLKPLGFHTNIFSNQLDGEASVFGKTLPDFIAQKSALLSSIPSNPIVSGANGYNQSMALVATGEFTVTIKGKGTGGRNQEMLLSFLHQLAKERLVLSNCHHTISELDFAVLSCAFDGIEGNSPATGAIVDYTSLSRLLEPTSFKNGSLDDLLALLQGKLDNNDSFTVFGPLEDAVITGYTGTNVNDLTMILLRYK